MVRMEDGFRESEHFLVINLQRHKTPHIFCNKINAMDFLEEKEKCE